MTDTTHKHQTILRGAAEELIRAGKIETFDAVYRWVCPDCGMPQRTTRLADTIYALRHSYGWSIKTANESGMLATYTLERAGDMPGDPNGGTHPRNLVREHVATAEVDLGYGPVPLTTSGVEVLTGYSPYDGKPVPVEAIPSPGRWRCRRCHRETMVEEGAPMLGGYRRVQCYCVAKLKATNVTIYEPVL